MLAPREKVRFPTAGAECAGWFYPGNNGGCVIMTGGFAVTKDPGTDKFASRFHAAGLAVLAYNYRCFGESDGQPRQVARIRDQLADWQAAITFAATLPGVDPGRRAIWSFSAGSGHIFWVAARNPALGAAIAQTPNADGLATTRNTVRYQTPLALARLTGRGVLDTVGGLAGRAPRLVPLAGEPGTVALLTTPDARSALRLGFYRSGLHASRIKCPLLVVACDQDQTAFAAPAIRAAHRAPRGELVRRPGGHYAPFLDAHEQAVAAELSFLRRHLLDHRSAGQPIPVTPEGPRPGGERP